MTDDQDLGLAAAGTAGAEAPAAASRRLAWAVAGLAALALTVVLAWLLVLRGGVDPISVEQAVQGFRAGDAPAAPLPPGVPVPESGVYVYDTRGSESVDIFLGQTHDYPEVTTIAVRPGGCGLTLAWAAFDERSTTWELCPARGGWEIARYTEYHRFFGTGEETDYRCEPGSVWLPGSAEAGSAWTRTCATSITDEVASGRVVGMETVRVDGTEVAAVHVSLVAELRKRTRGQGTFDAWLRVPDGLPVRLAWQNDNVSKSIAGEVHYTERAELTLASLAPER